MHNAGWQFDICDFHRKVGEEVAKDTPEEEIKLAKSFAAYMEENQVKTPRNSFEEYMGA